MPKKENILNQVPPQNIEAEQSVLGGLLIDKNGIIKIADFLRPDDFYKPAHQKIYETVLELFQQREPIDILNLTERLQAKKIFDDIGGATYLSSLANSISTASHIFSHAKIIQQKRLLRDIIQTSFEITDLGYQEERNIDELLDEVEQKIFQVTQSSLTGQQFKDTKEDISALMERLERQESKKIRGLGTGFPGLDHILSGLQKSDLIVLAARPSLGKTSLALNIAFNVALEENASVGIFSLEMPRDQVVDRLVSVASDVDLWKIRTGKLNNNDFEKLHDGINKLSQVKIYLDDSASSNIMRLRTVARRLQAEKGLDLIIVDYLQLIVPRDNKYFSVVQQVTEISRGLKALARELNIPIIAVSQLSREIERRDYKKPRLSDLRDSGSIEQDADVVMFIHRKDRIKDEDDVSEEDKNIAEIMIAKHRNGPLGKVELKFNPKTLTFYEPDKSFTEYEGEISSDIENTDEMPF
jgi:replicative DNA helicase